MAQRLNYNAARQSRSRPPPRPHPLALYNFKAPNGVRFPRPIFLRESGSCETLEDSCAPLFCGNQDSRDTRKDSGAAFFAAKRSQRITATFQRRTLFVMRSSLWRSDRARDFIILDKSPMKPPRLGEQNFSPILARVLCLESKRKNREGDTRETLKRLAVSG